jgi:hypothetical protein
MSDLAFECPACHTMLKSSVPAQPGKLIKCENCGALLSAPTGRSERALPSSNRRLELPRNGTSTSHDTRKPPLRLGRPEDDVGLSGLHRRLQRQAEAIQEAGREAAEEESRKIAEEAARLRRKQRRHAEAGQKKRMLLVAAGMVVAALVVLALVVGRVMNTLHSKTARSLENHGGASDDLLTYVPADSALIGRFHAGRLPPSLGAGYFGQIRVRWGANNFLRDSRALVGLDLPELLSDCVIAVGGGPAPSLTLVARSKSPFSQQKIVNAAGIPEFIGASNRGGSTKIKGASFPPQAQRHAGQVFFTIDAPPFTSLYMPSDEILVLSNAPEDTVLQMVASEKLPMPMDALEQISSLQGQECWLLTRMRGGMADPVRARLSKEAVQPPDAWRNVVNGVDQTLWLRATIQDSLTRIRLELVMVDNASAERLHAPVQALLAEAQRQANIQGAADLAARGGQAPNQASFAAKVFFGVDLDTKGRKVLMTSAAMGVQDLGTAINRAFEYVNKLAAVDAPEDAKNP